MNWLCGKKLEVYICTLWYDKLNGCLISCGGGALVHWGLCLDIGTFNNANEGNELSFCFYSFFLSLMPSWGLGETWLALIVSN